MRSFATEIAEILSPDDVGSAATISGLGTVNGVFTAPFTQPHESVESTGPVFLCLTTDIPGVTHGTTITIDSIAYTVRGLEPVQVEMTRLILELQ